jgi:hypothetical protein
MTPQERRAQNAIDQANKAEPMVVKQVDLKGTAVSKENWVTYFKYLDRLREAGLTNMFAAAPYLVEVMDLSKSDARMVLTGWMKTFGDGSETAEVRAEKVC